VENIPVGSLAVKSLPVKSLSTIVILQKILKISTFVAKSSSGFQTNFYHFVTNFRHITSFKKLKNIKVCQRHIKVCLVVHSPPGILVMNGIVVYAISI
jgi:hypothetical protein